MQIVLTTRQIRALPVRWWIAALLLAVYSIGHSCLPAGPAALKFGCRCDKILQETSSCCCLKKTAGKSGRSCCAPSAMKKKSAATTASCCRKPSPPAETSRACCLKSNQKNEAEESDSDLIFVTACSCDSPQDAGYLMNTDPRVTTDSLSVCSSDGLVETYRLTTLIPTGLSLSPDLPPPRPVVC